MEKILFITVLLLISFFSFQLNSDASVNSRAVYEKTGRVIWEVNTKEKLVALTFDDGPHPVFTPQILNILAKHDAKATFFVAGNKVVRYSDLLKREVKEGHEIANHTFHHIYGNITSAKLSSELDETDKIIKKFTGLKPSLYRPVAGFYNNVIINTAIKNGKEVVLWTWGQDSRDWADPPPNQIYNNITKGVKPGNIIIFHDWHGSEYTQTCSTTKALENILEFLDKNGYKCVTVTELLYRSTQIFPESFGIYPSKKGKTSHINLMF
ncbi:polysaccharide deacetylase family protein [Paenibacillus sp. BSR1-1]|uniref:polysaccharide deacetylase family protein n=1 Tax=Paenibacillus sp. BSR1-1 TaxID=3020845 RepID=UPI0025B00F46|nr:polysaccharide deacetylase family protein [Paenibacillus sp. BSR1-1]MDN3019493.1 polysaccharide deacetylase family protein [Paenibacillus sp. BSR1-1]